MKASQRMAGTAVSNLGLLLIAAAWYGASATRLRGTLPGPEVVAAKLVERLQEPAFLRDLAISSGRVGLSIVAAMLIGGVLALLPYWVPCLRSTVHQTIKPFFNAFPAVAWALLASIWFGVSSFSVIFVQTAILVPFCLINVSEGVRLLDRDLIEMGRSFATRRSGIFIQIVLPLLSPYLVSALRAAYGIAWKIALVSELFGSQSGLGFAMLRAETLSDVAGVLSICLLIAMLGIAGDRWIIEPLNRRTRDVVSF